MRAYKVRRTRTTQVCEKIWKWRLRMWFVLIKKKYKKKTPLNSYKIKWYPMISSSPFSYIYVKKLSKQQAATAPRSVSNTQRLMFRNINDPKIRNLYRLNQWSSTSGPDVDPFQQLDPNTQKLKQQNWSTHWKIAVFISMCICSYPFLQTRSVLLSVADRVLQFIQ